MDKVKLFFCLFLASVQFTFAQEVKVLTVPTSTVVCLGSDIVTDPKVTMDEENKMVAVSKLGFATEGVLVKDMLSSGKSEYTIKLRQVMPLPADFTSKKLEFGKLVDIEGELTKSALYSGYGVAQILNAEGSRYQSAMVEKLSDWGYNMVGSKNRLFEEKTEKADLILAGEIIKFEKGTKKTAGFRISVMVEWSMFDNRRKKVVYSAKSVGFSDSGKPGSIADEFELALGDAVIGLVTDQGFIDAAGGVNTENEPKGDELEKTSVASVKVRKFSGYGEMVKEVVPSVVTIVLEDGSHGSGFLISEDGLILTNNHVIEGADDIQVIFSSGLKLPAKAKKTNTARDIALVKAVGSGYSPFRLNTDSEAASLGTEVIAIGTPADIELGQTVTKGIVSGIRLNEEQKYIQTDVSINFGNSGGPLINENGEVVGVVVAKISSVFGQQFEGLGFAIPIGDALQVLNIEVTEK